MLDFVSTREETSETTAALARAVAAVIANAIRTACTPTQLVEREDSLNLTDGTYTALDYLFNPRSTFDRHLEAIGLDGDCLRAALLGNAPLTNSGVFTAAMRARLHKRYLWWASLNANPAA